MSNAALNAAFAAEIPIDARYPRGTPSNVKVVLIALANLAHARTLRVYASSEQLCQLCSIERKTVFAALQQLRELGWIADTGLRTGTNGRIPIYQFHIVPTKGTNTAPMDRTLRGIVPSLGSSPQRDRPLTGIVPSEGIDRPLTGTIATTSILEVNPSKPNTPSARARERSQPPDWIPAEQWAAWLDTRKKLHAPNTDRALDLAIKELTTLKSNGFDPGAVLDQSTMRGWRGLFPIKTNGSNGNGTNGTGPPPTTPTQKCAFCARPLGTAWIQTDAGRMHDHCKEKRDGDNAQRLI